MRSAGLRRAHHLLQEHHVGTDGTHRLSQFMQDELAVEEGVALVGVDGEYGEAEVGRGLGHGAQKCGGPRL
jgi:hypothetical protein